MDSLLASSVVDRGFGPRSGQTKVYKIGICCFFAKHTALRRKSKDWLARNQNNVSKWSDISTRALLFQSNRTIKIQLSMLVYYNADLVIISLIINLFSP
jgi:predicted LPLAT superfamily acyltransferase